MPAHIDRLPVGRPTGDVAVVHQLGRQFDEQATYQPPGLNRRESWWVVALIVASGVISALTLVGAVTVWRWLWAAHRAGIEQTLFVLVSFTIAGLVCRWVNVGRRR